MRKATSKDVAAALGVEPTTVQRYAREGRIPFETTPGGHRRFDVAEVVAALRDDRPAFTATIDPRPLGRGAPVTRSPGATRAGALRAMRVEEPLPAGARSDTGSALGDLFAHARQVLVTNSR